ncbi:hypothetical protein [Paenibacillus rigui]|uniref:Uncharacterized protein n=1 Tax=Paenibacillus rigui TaxID=554312 RepID=A0A229UQZ6_9BACL|nr:hypothetical protein [Paenibacillus rigui]OXM85820.1 hypothetical protein CF651_11320 [Paenibacillus rigui]
MQISNVQAREQLQKVQQISKVEGSASEEANESASEKANEQQKKAVAQSTGIGANLDIQA